MRNFIAVFLKQVKETFKNKAIFIQFVMFPGMCIVMENAVVMEDMPEHFFVKLFSVMFVSMAPLVCMSGIIAEEKEKNTLRTLLMCNVKPFEYLAGVGTYVFLVCMAGAGVFGWCGGYSGADLGAFLLIMAVGILLSQLTGAVIGVWSKDQMAATSMMVPVMMIFSFLPMLAMFNESIKRVAQIAYSQQLNILINNLGTAPVETKSIIVIGANFLVAAAAFCVAFKKKGLE